MIEKLYTKILDKCKIYWYPKPIHILYSAKNKWIINETANSSNIMVKAKTITTNDANDNNISYWKTNIQKINVDEPEILKLTKDYIAYFNKKLWKIYLIKSPVNWNKLDINKVEVSDIIAVPKLIEKYNVKMFFVNNQLIVIWSRYSKAFWWTVTDLVFYKIINWKAKFNRLYDTKWRFKDARIVNNKIYLITNYNFDSIANKACNVFIKYPLEKQIKVIKDSYQKQIDKEYEKIYKERDYDKIHKLRNEMNEKLQTLVENRKK